MNLVELFADEEEQKPSPCKYGNIVTGHACYCHHPKAYRKCPQWRMQSPYKECKFYKKQKIIEKVKSYEKGMIKREV